MLSSVNILGIQLHNLTKDNLWQILIGFLKSSSNHLIATVNAEFILAACNNERFRSILNQADLSLPDGSGPALAALTYGHKIARHTGADLTVELLAYAEQNQLPIAIINWWGGLSSATDLKAGILRKYPKLILTVEDIGRSGQLGQRQIKRLNNLQPRVMFCTLGAPWQEYFLDNHRQTIASVRLMIGVGGSFDFLIGRIKRAPLLLRKLGLEWLWRLIQQPWRWRRIWQAVPVFTWRFLIWRLFGSKKGS